jgi:hypothetical protein
VSLFGRLENVHDIDAAVHMRLASSLAHIFDRAESHLSFDRARVEAALERIRSHKQDPGVFARYYDLIFAITASQIAKADTLLDEIIERSANPVSFAITPYNRQSLGTDYDRFPKLLFSDFSSTNPMASPSAAQAAAWTEMLHEALEIVSRVDKIIYDEIVGLLARVYMAADSQDPTAKRFAGVTSFLVWGASFINIEFYKTRWDAVQFLVHEITHALLFALSFDEPLVQNSPDESYHSPLRADPRPMDGIFHATLVCARIAAFNQAWLESGLLEGGDRKKAEITVQSRKQKFRDGLVVIDRHGKLSEQGRHLINRCCSGLAALA